MGTIQSWRKAYGALKDQTRVGLAHVSSDFKDLDLAILKATNHVECPPKERHVRKILVATSAIRPRADVAYCIHTLSRLLAKTHSWTVALKTLIVIHRAIREGDPTVREELLNFQQRGCVLQMSNFKDDSSPIAWDCSAWVQAYALFLEERLECFRIIKYDIEAVCIPRPAQDEDKGHTRTRELESEVLLYHLPALQQLLYRLIGCRPEGAAMRNYVIQYALALVLKESFKIYCVINEGIINLVDKFFDMPRHEAFKAFDIYKRAGQQAAGLSDFYEICKGLELARNFQFPVLLEPPQSFLVTMEEYIKEAPRVFSVPSVALDYPERLMLTYKEEDVPSPSKDTNIGTEKLMPPPSDDIALSTAEAAVCQPPPTNFETDDLLGLHVTQDACAIEESNALALAIVPSGTTPFDSDPSQAKSFDPYGWELALVSIPSTNLTSVPDRKLGGGLDSPTLSGLYDDASYKASHQPNPFEVDPFSLSNTIHAPTSMVQNNPFAPFQPPYQQPHQQPPNPFDEMAFGPFPHASLTTNPFGSTGSYKDTKYIYK